MDESNRRIVLLGKTGTGKSSLANTILGEELFEIGHDPGSETNKCRAESKSVNGRSFTLIDTPGFFDTKMSEDELRCEIVKCIVECAPGPHAFLLLLKVERYTKKEQDVIDKIKKYFTEEVYKYVTVVFTHGDQLQEGQTIEDFVSRNEKLSDLVRKCGGRCHVIDSKYWRDKPQTDYRSNQFQVEEILKTIDKMVKDNNDGYYTNEMLQEVENVIKKNMAGFGGSVKHSEKKIRERAKEKTFKWLLKQLAGVATGVMLGALFGAAAGAMAVYQFKILGLPLIPVVAGSAVVGAAVGGYKGYKAAEAADSPLEAATMTAGVVTDPAVQAAKAIIGLQPKYKQSENKE